MKFYFKSLRFDFKSLVFFVCFFYLTLYIPLSFMVYSFSWYQFNYNFQETYQFLGEDITNNVTLNLINFFIYKEDLNLYWNETEILHMNDVRFIYTILFILAIFSFFGFGYFFSSFKQVKKFAIINILFVCSLFFILPFFVYFWDNIFHVILFNNNYWIITNKNISYYLFSYQFFKNSLLFLIIFSIFFNLSVLLSLYKKDN